MNTIYDLCWRKNVLILKLIFSNFYDVKYFFRKKPQELWENLFSKVFKVFNIFYSGISFLEKKSNLRLQAYMPVIRYQNCMVN
jgi:hypothetical protein